MFRVEGLKFRVGWVTWTTYIISLGLTSEVAEMVRHESYIVQKYVTMFNEFWLHSALQIASVQT